MTAPRQGAYQALWLPESSSLEFVLYFAGPQLPGWGLEPGHQGSSPELCLLTTPTSELRLLPPASHYPWEKMVPGGKNVGDLLLYWTCPGVTIECSWLLIILFFQERFSWRRASASFRIHNTLVSSGCKDEMPWPGDLNGRNSFSPQFWRLEVQDQGVDPREFW